MSREYAEKILKLIDKSPTAFHVIDNIKCILDAADFTGLKETDVWKLKEGGKYYVARNDSSIIAFTIPKTDYKGFKIIASVTRIRHVRNLRRMRKSIKTAMCVSMLKSTEGCFWRRGLTGRFRWREEYL